MFQRSLRMYIELLSQTKLTPADAGVEMPNWPYLEEIFADEPFQTIPKPL